MRRLGPRSRPTSRRRAGRGLARSRPAPAPPNSRSSSRTRRWARTATARARPSRVPARSGPPHTAQRSRTECSREPLPHRRHLHSPAHSLTPTAALRHVPAPAGSRPGTAPTTSRAATSPVRRRTSSTPTHTTSPGRTTHTMNPLGAQLAGETPARRPREKSHRAAKKDASLATRAAATSATNRHKSLRPGGPTWS